MKRLAQLLFLAGGAALLYTLSAQVFQLSQPQLPPRAVQLTTAKPQPQPQEHQAQAAGPTTTAPSSEPAAAAAAGSEAFWLPPSSAAASSTAPVSGCGPAPGNPKSQRAPVLLERGSQNPGCASATGVQQVACKLAAAAVDGEVLLLAGTGKQSLEALRLRLLAAREAARGQLLLLALDAPARELAQRLGVGWWAMPPAWPLDSLAAVEAAHWAAAAHLLRAGCAVVRSGQGVLWLASPFAHLSRDVDLEAAQRGGGEARGAVVGVHDPPMGWSAYGQTMTVPWLDAAVVSLSATAEAAELAAAMAHAHLAEPAAPAAQLLTQQAAQPAHDAQARAGVSYRVWRSKCFVQGAPPGWLGGGAVALVPASVGAMRSALAAAHPTAAAAAQDPAQQLRDTADALPPPPDTPPGGKGLGEGANDLLQSAAFAEARALVLSHGCAARPAANGTARPRPLNWLLPASEPFPREEGCKTDENVAALCGELKRVAVRREVLAAVSNKNILQMLTTFIEGTRRANITNTVIVALDEPTAEHVRKLGVATYVRQLRSRTGSTDNHATSGLKFAVLRDFVLAGCSVLLSDVDVVWLHNPFTLPSIYRTPRPALTRPLAACHA